MTLAIVAGILILIAIGVIAAPRVFAGTGARKTGFREYVKNPRLRARVARGFVNREAEIASLAQRPTEELVALLLDDDGYESAKRALCTMNHSVVPSLLAAAKDNRFRSADAIKQRSIKSKSTMARSEPLETVLECLQHHAGDCAVEPVAAFVRDPNHEIRKNTALLLGSIGTDAAVEPLRQSLEDDDDYVRSYAMMGVLRAIDANRCSRGFRTRVFDAIHPLVWREDMTVSGNAPRCLLGLNRDRAISILTAADSLHVGKTGLQDVLVSLRKAGIAVDPGRLLSLESDIEKAGLQYPNDYVLGETLRLLARVESDAARAAIERGTRSSSGRVRENATTALAERVGVTDPFATAFQRWDDVGWDRLTEPQKHVLAVRVLIDQVNNGGFAQYFVNSSGEHWPDALAGLEAIGATNEVGLVQRAVGLFGPDKPSVDGQQRHQQLARVIKRNDKVLDPIDQDFYKEADDREVLLLRYIIAHAADFRAE